MKRTAQKNGETPKENTKENTKESIKESTKENAKESAKEKALKRSFGKFANPISQIALCVLSFAYMELIYHLFIFHSFGQFWYYPLLFSVPVGLLLLTLVSIFPAHANKILLWVFLAIAYILYLVETVYQHIFKIPLVITDLGAGNFQVVLYYRELLIAIWECLPALLLLAVPLVAYGVLLKFGMKMNRNRWFMSLSYLAGAVLFAVVSVVSVNLSDREHTSIYENYHDMFDTKTAMENYGVLTTLRLNLGQFLDPDSRTIDLDDIVIETSGEFSEDGVIIDDTILDDSTASGSDMDNSSVTDSVGQPEADTGTSAETEPAFSTSPNIINIPFGTLAKAETDEALQKLHQYFASLPATRKNEYTGMFEGYNLIYITAEAFSPYCVDEELTPTLYKLVNNGFVFNNYYVPPTGESTCGGEFMNCTGLLTNPNRPRGVYSFVQTAENYLPFTMAHQFEQLGVTSYAYHNNNLTYYGRNLTLPNLGYIFKAPNAGMMNEQEAIENDMLFEMEHPNQWPQSDYEMIQATLPEYISQDEPFHAYYMTVSGHMYYSFSGNYMAYKNREAVEDLPYSSACKAYIACNIELDHALEYLIEQLEEYGVLDKTVICMSADHYPYGLTNEELSELAGHELETNFEIYKNNLILWNSAMETPVYIDKPCCSVDIIPTLSNLFGFTYDSRLLPGKDILSDSAGFVIMLGNRSFITDDYMYNSTNKRTTDLDGNPIEVPSEEISAMRKKVDLQIVMNQLLIETDYYNCIRDYLEKE